MSNNLREFLVELGENALLLDRFIENPDNVMAEFSLADEEISAVLSGDEDEIRILLGENKIEFRLLKIILNPPTPSLEDFLSELGGNMELLQQYIADPIKTIKDFGLSSHEQDVLLSGDEDAIRELIDNDEGKIVITKIILNPPAPETE